MLPCCVAMLFCHVHGEMQVCDVMLQNALYTMDVARASFWEKAGARNLVFLRIKWLWPTMKGDYLVCVCVRAVRLQSF